MPPKGTGKGASKGSKKGKKLQRGARKDPEDQEEGQQTQQSPSDSEASVSPSLLKEPVRRSTQKQKRQPKSKAPSTTDSRPPLRKSPRKKPAKKPPRTQSPTPPPPNPEEEEEEQGEREEHEDQSDNLSEASQSLFGRSDRSDRVKLSSKWLQGSKGRLSANLDPEQEEDVADWLKDHPALYDKKHVDFKKKEKKDYLFQQKADQLKIPMLVLKKWFESRRTDYGKLSAELAGKSGDAASNMSARNQWTVRTFDFMKSHITRLSGTRQPSGYKQAIKYVIFLGQFKCLVIWRFNGLLDHF